MSLGGRAAVRLLSTPEWHMSKNRFFLALIVVSALLCGCGSPASTTGGVTSPAQQPVITTANAQNGALIVTLASPTSAATIYYTLDATAPTTSSPVYEAPFLVTSSLTVKAIAAGSGLSASPVATQTLSATIPSNTLVWSDEFNNSTSANAQPNPITWTYDTGPGAACCGNNELENYCAWASATAPCNPANPNVFLDTAGLLHIVARQPSSGVYTSGRIKTQGLFSFQYGRLEAHIKLPESQGMWPAFWLLGNSRATIDWPACGEIDVMEHIDGSNPQNSGFDWVKGSIHGTNLNTGIEYHPKGFSAADWHTYGMIWTKGQIQYYVDDPSNIYATFTPSTQPGTWPFDAGPEFILLNLAVGGDWPGDPNAQTQFPSEMQVDYVRLYTN